MSETRAQVMSKEELVRKLEALRGCCERGELPAPTAGAVGAGLVQYPDSPMPALPVLIGYFKGEAPETYTLKEACHAGAHLELWALGLWDVHPPPADIEAGGESINLLAVIKTILTLLLQFL